MKSRFIPGSRTCAVEGDVPRQRRLLFKQHRVWLKDPSARAPALPQAREPDPKDAIRQAQPMPRGRTLHSRWKLVIPSQSDLHDHPKPQFRVWPSPGEIAKPPRLDYELAPAQLSIDLLLIWLARLSQVQRPVEATYDSPSSRRVWSRLSGDCAVA
jgi:hypothetical protein